MIKVIYVEIKLKRVGTPIKTKKWYEIIKYKIYKYTIKTEKSCQFRYGLGREFRINYKIAHLYFVTYQVFISFCTLQARQLSGNLRADCSMLNDPMS